MVNIALVGAGGRSNAHIPALKSIENARMIAVVDPHAEAAQRAAKALDCPQIYASVEDLLSKESPDAVFTVVPYYLHLQVTRPLIEANIPFFIEKPIATSLSDAAKIAQAVAEKGLLTAVGYQWRYEESVDAVKEKLSESTAAQFIARYFWGRPVTAWAMDRKYSGGQLLAQVTHLHDIARYLLGDVAEVYAKGAHLTRTEPDFHNWDNWTSIFHFESGALGTFYCTYSLFRPFPNPAEITVIARERLYSIASSHLEEYLPGSVDKREFQDQPVHKMDAAFVKAVQTGDRSLVRSTVEDAYKSAMMSYASILSNETGQPVRLKNGIPVSADKR